MLVVPGEEEFAEFVIDQADQRLVVGFGSINRFFGVAKVAESEGEDAFADLGVVLHATQAILKNSGKLAVLFDILDGNAAQ